MTSTAARRYSNASSDGSDAVEREALILHRLDTEPKTASASSYRKTDAFVDDDEDDIALPSRRNEDEEQALDKTGRPEWLKDGLAAGKRSIRLRIFFFVGIGLLLLLLFAFVFSSSDGAQGGLKKVYKWAGDVWREGDEEAESGSPWEFPIDVGYPGPTATGKAPQLANEDIATPSPSRGSSPIQTYTPELPTFDLFKHMGPLTPYTSAPDFGPSSARYRALSGSCKVDRVHILHRHGSRYPTSDSSAFLVPNLIATGGDKLRFTGPLSFLNSYDPHRLGKELLVPLGRQQLFDSGVLHAVEYGNLADRDIKQHKRLLIRTGSQQRIVDSTIAFLQGMWGAKWHSMADVEVQIEAPGFNTTLAPNFACPASSRPETAPGYQWLKDWTQDYLRSGVNRLKSHVQGIELNADHLYSMQQLCSYDTVAFGRSDFCGLFTKQEWLGYEYAWDLAFYGGYGPGSSVGKAQGVGWLNEFMSRLTGTKWDESTQTTENRTLNTNERAFPVDRSFYADFTHDSTIAGVLAAMSLPDFEKTLPVHQPDEQRKYRTSTLVPFGARLVFEEISCGKAEAADGYVRMLLNEAIVPLDQLSHCQTRADGMCARNDFIKALEDRNIKAQWSNCTAI